MYMFPYSTLNVSRHSWSKLLEYITLLLFWCKIKDNFFPDAKLLSRNSDKKFDIIKEKAYFSLEIFEWKSLYVELRGNIKNNDLSHQNHKAVCVSSALRKCVCEGQKPKYKQNRQAIEFSSSFAYIRWCLWLKSSCVHFDLAK